MGQDAMVTAADIARLAGVGRAAVSNWRRRHDDFPEPVGGTATSPVFSLAQVQQWLRRQGKLRRPVDDEHLWQELRRIAERTGLAEASVFAGAFLTYLHRDPEDWRRLTASTDRELAARLPRRIKAVVRELPGGTGLGTAPGAALPADCIPLVRRLAALAERRGPVEVFEFLRERYLSRHRRRVYEAPPQVVALVSELADSRVHTVLDPACGSGAFLLGMLERPDPPRRLLGQEADEAVARLTAVRLALRTPGARIRLGDGLRADRFPDAAADLVVTCPPFNDRNWGHEELATDPRWRYGPPPRSCSELAWAQHALARCRPGGLVVLLMLPAAALRRAGRRIRAELLRRGALRAIIALPPQAVPGMACHVWVLRRPRPGDRPPGQVLMVDVSGIGDDFAAPAAKLWHRFAAAPEADLAEPGLGGAVRIIDLLGEEVDLTPAHHIPPPPAAPAIEQVAELRAELGGRLGELAALLPEVEAGGEGFPAPMISLAELARLGLLRILGALPPSGAPPAGRAEEDAPPHPDPPVLTAEDVAAGTGPSGKADGLPPGTRIAIRPGDVLVPTLLHPPIARVAGERGAVLGRHLALLRPDPARLDPHFLAGMIRGSRGHRHRAALSATLRLDVRRIEIPLLTVEEQRRYGEAFRRLEEFTAALNQAGDRYAELAALIADGLADATLRPRDDTPPVPEERP